MNFLQNSFSHRTRSVQQWLLIVFLLLVILSMPLRSQRMCGVSVNIIPIGIDTIQGPAGSVERCIYRVELINRRNDVFSVRFDPIASSTYIWNADPISPSVAVGNNSGAWWFLSGPGSYPPSTSPYRIGMLSVSGPAPQQFHVTFRNANEQTICSIVVVGQCETRNVEFQGGCLVPFINISTGIDPATGSVIPITTTSYDPNWIVISDPFPTTNEPRPASVIQKYSDWSNPLPGSQWIAVYNSAANDTNGVYVFERCFCIEGETRAVVELQVLADDVVDSILVCGQRMTNRTPNVTGNWFKNSRTFRDTLVLRDSCCIRVYVRNTNEVAFGLNISGRITALDPAAPLLADTCCNQSQCWIVGRKIHDLNCNGSIDPGEPALSGWTITATAGGNTYTATTGSDGWYSIQVPPGTYTLTEQVRNGFTPSTPSGGPYIVTIAQGQVLRYDFLNCTAPPPCNEIGEPRLDSACCQFTIPIFPATSTPGVTEIQWSLSGGTMESITNFTGCAASYPNPYGQISGTITFTPPCTNSPMNLAMEVTPTNASGVVTLYLEIKHGDKVCYDTLTFHCARAPITKCDSLAVTPFIWNGLNLSGRTFRIFNQKVPPSPIEKVLISFNPPPCSSAGAPQGDWNGGGLLVDNQQRSWGVANSGVPKYSQVALACDSGMSASQGAAANNTVQFNLGVDYTCNWTGSVTLTVIHCDGDTCVLTYPEWCALLDWRRCARIVVIDTILIPVSTLRTARLVELQLSSDLVPGKPELHACYATVVPVGRGWDVVGVSVDDGLTPDEREAGRGLAWRGSVSFDKTKDGQWARVQLRPCVWDTVKGPGKPWLLRVVLTSPEDRTDTPRVAVTFYDADGNPISSDTAKAAMQVTSVPVEVVKPAGGSSGILQVVPNPAIEEVRVEYVLARASEVVVEVCDVQGKCRLKAELGWMPAGRNSFGMSTQDLPSGSYVLRIRTSAGVLTAPLQIVR